MCIRDSGKPIDRSRVTDIEEIGGNGVIAKVEGVSVAAGNAKLMNRLGIAYKECHHEMCIRDRSVSV